MAQKNERDKMKTRKKQLTSLAQRYIDGLLPTVWVAGSKRDKSDKKTIVPIIVTALITARIDFDERNEVSMVVDAKSPHICCTAREFSKKYKLSEISPRHDGHLSKLLRDLIDAGYYHTERQAWSAAQAMAAKRAGVVA